MSDQYLDLIDEHWSNIIKIYAMFENKKPIIEYDVSENKIYSYPASEYINNLTERTRRNTLNKYYIACDNSQFMLFIRDVKNNKLRSYIFDQPE